MPATLQVFLSHRYKSPEVNLYFFDIFREFAQVQFEVDKGSAPISVTRLERMIQEADAFVGIYPFPDPEDRNPPKASLVDASKYFRLELDLALRARKPALVFFDRRYGGLLQAPPPIAAHIFEIGDVLSRNDARRERHRRLFENFLSEAISYANYQSTRAVEAAGGNRVAILLPISEGYSADLIRMVEEIVQEHAFDTHQLRWPPRIDHDFYTEICAADWCITDIGPGTLLTGIAPFLHGRFVPTLRALDTRESEHSPIESTLYGAFEVGYSEDILRWKDETSLREGLRTRLSLIQAPVESIFTEAQAEAYFRRAALRKEAVFLSYSGTDQEAGARISKALRKKFKDVFDYRDGKSITPGVPWMDEIFRSLAGSAIGVPLFSANYFASGNCEHEARELISRSDSKQMFVFPIHLSGQEFKLPDWARSTQYALLSQYADEEAIVAALVGAFEKRASRSPAG
jgi:TIR domain